MNIRSLYRLSLAIENLLDDIVDGNVDDENEVLEILLDAKRLTDLLSQELNNYIIRVTKG
ncbi:ORF C59 [Sulfolobus virus Ragged Hills]|uniref:ORF C59 n=1 Tax=Sulfolobus virus Ragged Hills TaxID=256994 RepID=Q6TRU3_9VIRU|nr:ORF C59 [Sulfolobus virus Ragged Hills]AAR27918.1 ORF C59 [Sulfolobus virus Ragged Hills]